jgi:hypothetical protein
MILKLPGKQYKNVPLNAGPKGEGCGLQRVLVLRVLSLELGSEGLMLTPPLCRTLQCMEPSALKGR